MKFVPFMLMSGGPRPQTIETHLSLSRGNAIAQASAYGPPPDIAYKQYHEQTKSQTDLRDEIRRCSYQNTIFIQLEMLSKLFQVLRMIKQCSLWLRRAPTYARSIHTNNTGV